jgi:hypothetical protein
VLIYAEPATAWNLSPSPRMKEYLMTQMVRLVKRDRNHPSLVLWGLLNESSDNEVYQYTIDAVLPAARKIDPTRPILSNSGGYANDPRGTLCLQRENTIHPHLKERHWYIHWPMQEGEAEQLRGYPLVVMLKDKDKIFFKSVSSLSVFERKRWKSPPNLYAWLDQAGALAQWFSERGAAYETFEADAQLDKPPVIVVGEITETEVYTRVCPRQTWYGVAEGENNIVPSTNLVRGAGVQT